MRALQYTKYTVSHETTTTATTHPSPTSHKTACLPCPGSYSASPLHCTAWFPSAALRASKERHHARSVLATHTSPAHTSSLVRCALPTQPTNQPTMRATLRPNEPLVHSAATHAVSRLWTDGRTETRPRPVCVPSLHFTSATWTPASQCSSSRCGRQERLLRATRHSPTESPSLRR